PSIELLVPDLLGRHISCRACGNACTGEISFQAAGRRGDYGGCFICFFETQLSGSQLRQPKIEDLHRSGLAQKDVRRLDVAVNDSFVVRSFQPPAYLDGDLRELVEW